MDFSNLLFPLALSVHALMAVIWVGGMFFAYMVLRPVAAQFLEPPQRLGQWQRVLGRFFRWVWLAAILLPASGYWMMLEYYGGFGGVGWHVHVMQLLGIIMILIFLHVFFAPYRRLSKNVKAENYPEAAKALAQIRVLVGWNTIIGLVLIAVTTGLRYVTF